MAGLTHPAKKLVSPSAIFLMTAAFFIPQGTFAQDRGSGRGDSDPARRLGRGAAISVRAVESIDSRAADHVNFRGFVTNDVRADNGSVVIPAGSPVAIRVRVMADNNLRLGLRSINIRGAQYSVETDPMDVEAQQQGSVPGGINGALSNGEPEEREVHIPRDAVLTFRLQSPLVAGRPDRDSDRDRDRPDR